jgi:hypothetical protein
MRIGSPIPQAPPESARLARIAWFVSFVVTVTVIAALLLVKSAQANTGIAPAEPLGPPIATIAVDDEEAEEEAEGFEFEESEEDEEEGDEASASGEPPVDCGLRTARASVIADESQSRLRTNLSYTSFEPVNVAIEFRLKGGKGATILGRDHKRLGESGVIHASEHLGKAQLTKVLAAKSATVTIKVLDAPGYCSRYFDRHLKSRRAGSDQVTWVQSDSVFGG